jgi:ABC-2 type transport system permease protein
VLPGTAAGSLVGSLIGVDAGGGTPGVVDAVSGTQATWTVLAYVVALPLLSVVLVRRRDVA